MAYLKAASLAQLPEGGALGVEVAGLRVALARVGDEVYAIADNCSHRDFPLSHGEVDVEACTLTCEWHGAAFDLRTGVPTCAPATRPVAVFETKVEGGSVWVDVGDRAGSSGPRLAGILGLG
ncbi:MAG TPA: non-heme iron oxygenase ferredoxin subunit [Longimicrobium sp.]|nr:non-heme iron oxygenase ferredoxin subunit [Longimicrobium sp.]